MIPDILLEYIWWLTTKSTVKDSVFINFLTKENFCFYAKYKKAAMIYLELCYSYYNATFFNQNSVHLRLNKHYAAWSYKKRKHKK